MLCDYGCGKEAIYQLKNGKWCCQKSQNSCDAVKNKVVIEITDFEGYKICDYGCGEKASYRFTNGKVCCCYSYKSCSAVREKNKKSNIGRIGPNKGKKTGPLTIEHRQKLSKSLTSKKHTKEHNKNIGKGVKKSFTKERREKLSKWMKNYGFLIRSKITKISNGENHIREIIKKIYPDCEFQKQILNYEVDVAISFKKIIVEYDGYYHFDTEEHKEYHKKRQKEIEGEGWKFLRYTMFDKLPTEKEVRKDIKKLERKKY